MRVRALISSCVLHLAVILLLLLSLRSWSPVEEIPVEITEFLKARPGTSPPRTRTPQPKGAPKTSTDSMSTEPSKPTSAPASSENLSAGSNESTGEARAEEYQVSELPTLINEVRIPYPPSAKARGVQGAVVFDIIVNSRGEVQSAKVVKSPSPELSDAAKNAVAGFRFRPARIGDKPVAIQIRYTYRFILE
jgi:protein TonB